MSTCFVTSPKNAEDTTWGALGTFGALTTVGIFSLNVAAIKEQLRIKYTVAGSNPYDAVHFLMLAPSWRPY